MPDTRDLKRRIDDLVWTIRHLKARIAITEHACPHCFAAPGVACTVESRFDLVHPARPEILESAD